MILVHFIFLFFHNYYDIPIYYFIFSIYVVHLFVHIYIYIEYVNKYDNKITNCFCIHIYKYNI